MRKLVLWGHQIDEYKEMFDLSEKDFEGKILEYGGGLSAINSELHKQGKKIISVDPLFVYNKDILLKESSIIFEEMINIVKEDIDKFNFSRYDGLDGLIEKRRQGMIKFFNDYEAGKKEKRYQATESIKLPFDDFEFDLSLSSHYILADNEDDLNVHLNIIKELLRVSKEVRIFPIIDRFSQPSKFLGPIMLALQQENYGIEVREVKYHLQSQGNAMLRVWAQQCAVV